ncbi:DUF4129 domain-containing protein [Ferrimicrobium acidiphilum]|uniref:DUF4129 domain-containing protein n=1 Tax=Ferrimicrobium acidiphilum TaxID=121039 RepID=UPI0023F3AD86|nr:DUF4129 domain-containing protein [Ferrimicrobium acidiphilum]
MTQRSRWLALGGVVVLIAGIGLEGVGNGTTAASAGITHRALLTALVRSAMSGVVALLVVGFGLLAATVLRRASHRGSRWLVNQDDPFAFPWWLKLLVSAGAIFFLVFIGFLFSELAPRRRHQARSIQRHGVTRSPVPKVAQSGLTHFDYLVPLVVGVAVLIGLGVIAKLRQRSQRRRSQERPHHLHSRASFDSRIPSLAQVEGLIDPREKVYACWDYAETRLFQLGIRRLTYESPTEFVSRVRSSLPFPSLELETLANLFVEARYSDHGIGQKDSELAYAVVTLFDSACERQRSYA